MIRRDLFPAFFIAFALFIAFLAMNVCYGYFMKTYIHRGWLAALTLFADRRQVIILALGFSSGLPLALTLATLSYWLSKSGVDKTSIGLFALVGLPYSLKFLWAPLIDQWQLPVLAKMLGRRRSWVLVTQALLILAILGLSQTNPLIDPGYTALFALMVAFASASQDIVIDAYRIDILEDDEQGTGAAMIQYGYRIGMLVSGAGAIALGDYLNWELIYQIMAFCVLFGVAAVYFAPEPNDRLWQERRAKINSFADTLREAVIEPFSDFMSRPFWIGILGFVILYKFGDAIGGVMANPFYHEIGFTGVEIAGVTKVFGLIAALVGVFVGGILVAHWGIYKALVVGGILQALTNLCFAWLAYVGNDITALALGIAADNFTGGLGTTAFVAYLSSLCNPVYSATQYALLTSFMAVGRTMLSASGGWLADQMGWVEFFISTTLLAIPGLILLFMIMTYKKDPNGR